jgi:TrmH family RNA methyltransferase
LFLTKPTSVWQAYSYFIGYLFFKKGEKISLFHEIVFETIKNHFPLVQNLKKTDFIRMDLLQGSHIKTIQHLREREFREHTGFFWAEGERTVFTLLEKNIPMEFAVLSESSPSKRFLFPKKSVLFSCREKDIKKIKATETFPGIGAVFRKPPLLPLEGETCIALDAIQDPGNLGTLIRTALWFGVSHLLLDRKSADPFHEKTVRASMGAIAGVHIHVEDPLLETLKSLKNKNYTLIGTGLQGESCLQFPAGKKIIVFGNEAQGISKEILALCDHTLKISGSGKAESLNVAVAAGILMHALFMSLHD